MKLFIFNQMIATAPNVRRNAVNMLLYLMLTGILNLLTTGIDNHTKGNETKQPGLTVELFRILHIMAKLTQL